MPLSHAEQTPLSEQATDVMFAVSMSDDERERPTFPLRPLDQMYSENRPHGDCGSQDSDLSWPITDAEDLVVDRVLEDPVGRV
jgi:hypothetical protein